VSANWSGYVVSGAGPYSSVSASWIQTAVNCAATPTGFSAFWVGIDGNGSNTVEQTGSEANCSRGGASYAAWYEMFPKRSFGFPDKVEAGDHFTASVTVGARGRFQLTLSDATQRWSETVTRKRRGAKKISAEVIAEAPSSRRGVLPLADFGTLEFSGASVDGSLLTSSTPGIEPLTMAEGATIKASPSSLSGGAFSVSWKHE
jgi:Peptidase A4 family